MFKDELRKFVEDNPKLVLMKPAGDGIFVLKYKKNVFYNDLWNEYLEECRGTIVDADFNVISRPFTKIYNFRVESKSPVLEDSETVTAYRKVNGFMVAMTWYNKDVLVSTTGSTDSDFVRMAKEMMLLHRPWEDWQMAVRGAKDTTLMFECVHPEDPHICPEDAGMYFLGYRENTWESKVKMYGKDMADWARDFAIGVLGCRYAEHNLLTVGELVAKAKNAKHEGFVFYTADHRSAKIKTKYYLVQKALARKKDILSMNRELLDEEFYPLVNHLSSIRGQFNLLDEQSRLEYMRKFLENS